MTAQDMTDALYRLQEATRPHVRAELRHSSQAALDWLRAFGTRLDPCVELETGKAA